MVCHQFNISGFICILNTEKLAEYPNCIFSLLANSKLPIEKDNAGNIFINRNPTYGKIIYDMLVHDYKYRFLNKLIDRYYLTGVLRDDLITEFSYYGLPTVFSDVANVSIKFSLFYGNGDNHSINLNQIIERKCQKIQWGIKIFVCGMYDHTLNTHITINFSCDYKLSARELKTLTPDRFIELQKLYGTGICTIENKMITYLTIDDIGNFSNGDADIIFLDYVLKFMIIDYGIAYIKPPDCLYIAGSFAYDIAS